MPAGLAYCNTLSHAPCVYGAYGTFSLSLVSAGQAVVLIRATRACGEFKRLSNQQKERGSVHWPLGHDALTPIREVQSQKVWNQAHLPNASLCALDLEELMF